MPRKGLLERLADGVVIGDGGFVTIMEKRGYTRIGAWAPEATVEHPEAGTCTYIELWMVDIRNRTFVVPPTTAFTFSLFSDWFLF